MRILHTGDLHLDSAFCAYSQKDAESRRQDGRELLVRIFECAKKEACDMILIAGDLFDGRFVTPETAELFCSLVENIKIPIVIAPGNHDFYSNNCFYATAQKRLGDVLTVFTAPEVQVLDFDELGVRVFGYAFCSAALTESPLADFVPPSDNGYIRLFCGHADMSSPLSRYAPLRESELQRADFDYAALGHIHNAENLSYLGGRARYCGFAQGRSFDELGEGGVLIVDVDREQFVCRRKILSKQSFFMLEMQMPEGEIEAALCKKIKEQEYPSGANLRLYVSGSATDEEAWISEELTVQVCTNTGLDYLEIIDQTLPVLDGEYLERDTTLRGELYRTLLPKLLSDNSDERRTAIRALRIGLAAIDGKNIFNA